MFTDTGSIAVFLFPFDRKVQKISLIKIGKFVVPDLVTSCNINIVFSCYSLHLVPGDWLAVFHMFAEFVAFMAAGNITDMTDSTINVVKKSFFLQIDQTERIADILTTVINNLRISTKFPEFLLETIALENGSIIIIVMKCDNTYSLFFHKNHLSDFCVDCVRKSPNNSGSPYIIG